MARKLTKTKAPTEVEQLLYTQFLFLCYAIAEFHPMVSIGSKFSYGDKKPVYIEYKKSGEVTKWIYVYPEDKCIHNIHNMYFWSVTIDSQKTIIAEMRKELRKLRASWSWQDIRHKNRQRKIEVRNKLKEWRNGKT